MMTLRNYGKLDEQVPEIVFALGADRQGKPAITIAPHRQAATLSC